MGSKASPVAVSAEPTTASFHFREKGKVQPKGYEGLGIDQDVTVILKGKVTRLGTSSWEGGKGFEIEIAACEITAPAGESSLDGALAAADKSRKRV